MTEHPTFFPEPDTRRAFACMDTGVPGLDAVLGGGIPVGSMLVVVGAPGSGKTVLSQQLCFNLIAQADHRVLYFTTLTEPHNKLIRQIESFEFYAPQRLGTSMVLLSLEDFLKQGLAQTAEAIVQTTRQHKARLVCIDGFRAIEAINDNQAEARHFLYYLSSQLHMLGTTIIITLERDVSERDNYGIYTIADGVLACHYDVVGVRHRRKLEIQKLRTMMPLAGLHSYRITSAGWHIFPRLEALISSRTTAPMLETTKTASFDIAELDQILEGGVRVGSTTLVLGELGVGKTLLSFYFLNEAFKRGEAAMFIGFNERQDQLLNKAKHFGLPMAEALEAGLLEICTFAPTEVEPDELSTIIRQAITERQIRRLVIDEVYELERATLHEERAHDFFGALATYLRDAGVTVLVTKGLSQMGVEIVNFGDTPLAVAAETLIVLRNNGEEHVIDRSLRVLNMRNGNPDRRARPYVIGAEGFVLASEDGPEAGIN